MPETPFSQQDLLDIVASASTIDERLGNRFCPDNAGASDEIVNARLEEWCQVLTKGNWEQFRQRLAWDGLDVDTVRRVLGPVRLREGMPLPGWVETLNEVRRMASVIADEELTAPRQTGESHLLFLDPSKPLPFEEIIAPFVVVARQKLLAQADAASHLLSDAAHIALQRNLLEILTFDSERALYLEFAVQRAQSTLDQLVILAQETNNRTHYQQFVEWMRRGGLAAFFQEYTVLARLLATITDLWVEATVEFLQRLSSDWSAIQQLVSSGGEEELGQVMTIKPSLSDPHRGRRSVIALTFASGRKVVYKPKDLGTEEAYNRLLAWFNAQGRVLSFKVLRVLNRSSHGWVEYVEHEPCKDQQEAQRYYRRAGMLLCLVYALEGTDCHWENILASGEYPVLVDVETLMHHRPRLENQDDGAQAQALASEQLAYSVLRTALLPSWQIRNDDSGAYDISGLGGSSEQERPMQVPDWEHINTDRMTLEYRPARPATQTNRPTLDGIPLRLEEHTAGVIAGFRQMYHFLLDHREALLAPESPLQELAHQHVRFIYRNTWVYGLLFKKLLNPSYLRDGADRSIQLELMGRALILVEGPSQSTRKKPGWWPVFAVERLAMDQADIPIFTARADSDALIVAAPGQEIEAQLDGPSFDRVVTRLKALSDADLEQQVGFISGSLYAHRARESGRTPAVKRADRDASRDGDVVRSPTLEELTAEALSIAEQIATRAIRASDGSAAWVAPQYLVRIGRYQLQPMGYDLYSGTPGVALFLAALEKATSGAGYRDLALGALQPLRHALHHAGQKMLREMGIGGAAGLGSVTYLLTKISRFLDDPALLMDARQAVRLITPTCIADDKALDILLGAAGTILGLLALYDVSPDQELLDQAIACGQHLLQKRTTSEAHYRAWQTLDGTLLTGFSHGAAGIAYALLRLYEATQDAAYLEAAREGIAYENSLFSPDVGNWPDLRAEEQPSFRTSWCHGAPGIALARMGGLPVLDTAQIRGDIETALQTIERFDSQGNDNLCCGSPGLADVLLVAADRLSHPELATAARRRVWQVVMRAKQTGSFLLHPLLPRRVYNPSFFLGTAGIGYALLRLAYPDVLPSVLLWE